MVSFVGSIHRHSRGAGRDRGRPHRGGGQRHAHGLYIV